MALMLNLYGHPAAGRNWDKTRNAGIKEDFSKQPWTVLRCIKEPCLFYFELTRPNTVERVYALIHTDDADMIGDSDEVLIEVYNIVKKRWG